MSMQESEPTARHTFSLFNEHHPPQEVSDLLLTHQQPFTLRGVPADADEPSKPVLATRWRPHDGDMFVWLRNNVTIYDAQFAPTEKPIIDGFFMLDRRPNMTKLLFLPHHGMFGRDTFRGWGNGFETQSSLLDIIYDGPRKLNSNLRLYNTMNYGSKHTAGSPASIQGKGRN